MIMKSVPSTLGIEVELSVLAVDQHGGPIPTSEILVKLMKCALRSKRVLLSPSSVSFALTNGGMIGLDVGKLEIRTPGCQDAIELERYRQAMLETAVEIAEGLAASDPGISSIVLSRGTIDYHTGASWGGRHTHVSHACCPETLYQPLTALLVALAPIAGEGGFDALSPGLAFVRSPRLTCFRRHIDANSQGERPIIHTKQPRHTNDGRYIFHSLLGANNCSTLSSVFFSAVLHRAIHAIDRGRFPKIRLLDDPVTVLRQFNHNITSGVRTSKGIMTAWQILEHWRPYLHDAMPVHKDNFHGIWKRISEAYVAGQELSHALDSDIKKFHYKAYIENQGLEWEQVHQINDVLARHNNEFHELGLKKGDVLCRLADEPPTRALRAVREVVLDEVSDFGDETTVESLAQVRGELFALDTKWGLMNANGIFNQLESQGVVDHGVDGVSDIARAMLEPSSIPRDKVRGNYVLQHGRRQGKLADWDGLYDASNGTFLDLSNPFEPATAWKPIVHLPRTFRENDAVQRRLPVLSQVLNNTHQGESGGDSVPSVRQLAMERIYA